MIPFNRQKGQRSRLKVKQCLQGLAITWDGRRGQRVCVFVVIWEDGTEKAARKGKVGKMKGRKRTVENRDAVVKKRGQTDGG